MRQLAHALHLHTAIEVGFVSALVKRILGCTLDARRHARTRSSSASRVSGCPLRGDFDTVGEELHRAVPSDIVIAELGSSAVEPTECEGLSRDRDTDINTQHGGAEAAGEVLGIGAALGVDGGGVTVGVVVLNLQSLIEGVHLGVTGEGGLVLRTQDIGHRTQDTHHTLHTPG